MSGDWSGLGFDPAPGNLGSAQALVDQLTNTSKYLRETHDVLMSVKNQQDAWTGEASKAFGEKLGELPSHLDNAHTSLTKASGLLTEWKGKLDGYQKTAKDLEARAKQAKGKVASADQAYAQSRGNPDLGLAGKVFGTDAELQAAQGRYNAAKSQLDQASNDAEAARDALDDLIKQAKDLQDRHEDEAERIADLIETAGEDYSPDEGFFEAIGNWLERNAELIGQIADIAGVVSAIAGALAFIPVLAPIMAPIALVAGGIALLGHTGAMIGKGEYGMDDWVNVVGDFAGVIPGVGAAIKGVGLAADAAPILGKAGAVVTGADAMGQVASQPARLFQMASEGLMGGLPSAMADNVAKAMQSSINLTAQVPTVVEWATPGETEKDRKSAAGWLAGVANVFQVR
ncbi:hypothetical protein LWC34_34575 [Kibdelosporangium philippinense]|uniref:WXG100 family type VII secretion target n=1 Tax=Kibdelosporangium philippinense TaxID=211113 RepID=A0ABS8ZJJ3_9PSEU|nr:hypothetical protein [Kibdelosporangium philippinense]MCE7007910.1 hypothetical protein [Kibdelosporangium philippinense]